LLLPQAAQHSPPVGVEEHGRQGVLTVLTVHLTISTINTHNIPQQERRVAETVTEYRPRQRIVKERTKQRKLSKPYSEEQGRVDRESHE
jgi:hypothetical protein